MKKNFFYNLLLTVSSFLFPLVTFPYLSRILGANGLGICNFIISYGQNFMAIAALGIPLYGVREIAKAGDDTEKRSKIFYEILTIHLLVSLILFAFYVASVLSHEDFQDYTSLALVGGGMILFNVFSIEWLFVGVSEFKYITLRSLVIRALSVVSVFIFVKEEADFGIYFFLLAATMLATVLVDVYSAKKIINRKWSFSFTGIRNHFKPLIILGLYIVLTKVYGSLPPTLLGFYSTKAAVGYYYSADRIVGVAISVFSSLIVVLIPALNLIAEKKQTREYLNLIDKALNVAISFGVPITLMVYLLADPLVLLLGGEGFINSIPVVRIMSPTILMVAFAQVFVLLILNVYKKDSEMVMLAGIGMVVSLIINILLIPVFAEWATGLSKLMAEFFVTLTSFFLARKVVPFHFPGRKLVLNILGALPFILITHLVFMAWEFSFFRLLFSGLFGGLYFMVYQIVWIKDDLIVKFVSPYVSMVRRAVPFLNI